MGTKIVVIESPYAGDIKTNEAYATQAMFDSLMRGEAPCLSHLLYTRCLDDTDPDQRKLGIEAGYAFYEAADSIVFYADLGFSRGMRAALLEAEKQEKQIEVRFLRDL